MKLLFGENLSFKLAVRLNVEYLYSSYVRLVGLRGASDQKIWQYARDNGFILISKDDDFRDFSLVHGAPPKVILLTVGNDGTQHIKNSYEPSARRLKSSLLPSWSLC
ncbi:MAG: hypothetical protein CK529_07875 [Rhodospirillaceae bacterium]|nr:MAG: hypothetical protein CK529_07875 [Rhodospirillaceae bacterium]